MIRQFFTQSTKKTEPPNLYIADLWKTSQDSKGIEKNLMRILTHTDKQHIEPEGVSR